MGSRLVLGLFVVAAVGVVLYVALSGGDPAPVDEGATGPSARPDEAVVAPPIVPVDPGAEPVEIPVTPETISDGAGRLLVTVTDPEKQPVAGSIVRVGGQQVTTGADGLARFDDLPSGKALPLTARGPGADDVIVRKTVRSKKDEEVRVSVVIRPGGGLAGVVYGPGGAPLAAGFRVRLEPTNIETHWSGRMRDFSPSRDFPAGNGTFAMRGVRPGGYVARAEAKGYVSARSEPFRVEVEGTTEGIEITLGLGGSVSGVVVDRATGSPVRGARVGLGDGEIVHFISSGRGPTPVGSHGVTTDETGAFLIEGVKPGTYRVTAAAKGHTSDAVEDVVVTAGGETGGIRLSLGRGGTITGTVYGPDGKPKAGARIIVQHVAPNFDIQGDFGLRVTTDKNGKYTAGNLEPGRYRVKQPRAAEGGGMIAVAITGIGGDKAPEEEKPLEADMVQVREGQVVTKDLRAELRATIEGTVAGTDGKPLREQVRLRRVESEPGAARGPRLDIPQMRYPDAEGTFEFTGIAPGTWKLSCGEVTETITVEPGETREVKLVLAPARVEGIVTDESGRPVAGAEVRLHRIRGPEPGGISFSGGLGGRRKTDANGRFSLPKVNPGRYTATARKGRDEGTSAEFEVPRDGLVKDIRVVLEALTELRVRVVDAEGKPVEKAWVSVALVGAGAPKSGRTTTSGVAVIHVPAGKHHVTAFNEGRVGTETVTVRPGNPGEIEIRLR